jgi:hypothetical protein
MVSSDGITWTRHSVNEHEDPIDSMPAMVFGGGEFVAVGGSYSAPSGGSWFILSSPDGINWNRRRLCSASPLSGLAYGSGSYVVVGRTLRSSLPAPGMWRSGGEAAPPRFISERTRLTGDIFYFYYGVEVGGSGTFTVEYTTDFHTWTPLWPLHGGLRRLPAILQFRLCAARQPTLLPRGTAALKGHWLAGLTM